MSCLAIIQARYSSTRFPGKALALLNGKPIINHVYDRAKQIRGVDWVIIAMPRWGGQDKLIQYVLSNRIGSNAHIDMGDEDDVLGRFARACQTSDIWPDVVLRVTADCPLLEPVLCERLMEGWRASGYDYGWIRTDDGTYPDGLDCEVFTRDLLMQAHMQATDSHDREHVTPIMRRMRSVYSLPADPAYKDWPKVSIDTPEDLERVREWMQQH